MLLNAIQGSPAGQGSVEINHAASECHLQLFKLDTSQSSSKLHRTVTTCPAIKRWQPAMTGSLQWKSGVRNLPGAAKHFIGGLLNRNVMLPTGEVGTTVWGLEGRSTGFNRKKSCRNF